MKEKNKNVQERRYWPVPELRVIRAEGKMPKIVGYAAVFNKLSEDFYGWREKIAHGAFTNTIEVDDIRALVDHDSSKILGRNKADTLKLEENSKGLKVTITPPDTSTGRDIITSIERGDVSGMSFGFKTVKDEWNTVKGEEIRTLKEVKLYDVSPVTFPAYPDTTVGTRSFEQRKEKNKPEGHKERMKMQLDLEDAKD